MATKKVTRSKDTKKPAAKAPAAEQAEGRPSAERTMLAAELREVAGSLQLALSDIIEAHTEEDSQAFGLALRRVNSARVVLEGEASKLEVQP